MMIGGHILLGELNLFMGSAITHQGECMVEELIFAK
jgi:hypothetical protein